MTPSDPNIPRDNRRLARLAGASLLLAMTMGSVAFAADQPAAAPAADAGIQPKAAAPDSLVVYFESGSAAIRQQDRDVLDHAARLYRDGHPLVMLLTGSADAVGSPVGNLALSEQRATAVFRALVERGIPAERFQVLAKGFTDPSVATQPGIPEARNRRVEITWR